jgi:HK97 family phage major capsid protein
MLKNKYHMRGLVLVALATVAGLAHAMGFVDLHTGAAGLGLAAMAMGGEIDAKGVTDALAKITDQVKEAGEKAIAEAQKGIAMTTAEKARVDELLMKTGEMQQQLKAIEQAQAAAKAGGEDNTHLKSTGYQVIESKEFKDSVAAIKSGDAKRASFGIKAVTSASAPNAVVPDRRPGVLVNPQIRLTIRDLIMPGRTNSAAITYMKQTGFTNNAAPVAEGARKPESTLTLAQTTESVKKLAHFIKASSEILADFPMMQSMIDGQLVYGLKLIEEGQLLKGSGSGNNLNGIYTQATAYALPTGAVAAAATIAGNIDKLRLALLQSELALFPSDGIVTNQVDWANIELAKTTYGEYLIGNPQGTMQPTLWNRPVVATPAMTVNTFLVGAFGMGAQIFDREDAAIVIATENEDDFVVNLVTILLEERLAMAVYRPEAFIKGTLAAA